MSASKADVSTKFHQEGISTPEESRTLNLYFKPRLLRSVCIPIPPQEYKWVLKESNFVLRIFSPPQCNHTCPAPIRLICVSTHITFHKSRTKISIEVSSKDLNLSSSHQLKISCYVSICDNLHTLRYIYLVHFVSFLLTILIFEQDYILFHYC